jgi:hypothetical protein
MEAERSQDFDQALNILLDFAIATRITIAVVLGIMNLIILIARRML